jgi:aminomethyltransferase
MAAFAGWDMPISYEGIVAEHLHTRNAASVFDICHMGEFLARGPGALHGLEQALSHKLDTLEPGKCRYGFLLTPEGGVLDDLIVYALDRDHFMLVVNAACAAGDFAVLRERLPRDVEMEDVSAATGKIDLQGPASLDVLEEALKERFRDLGYFSFRVTEFEGKELMVSRTGYTGELGFELYIPQAGAPALWDRIAADPRVRPAGLGARDTLRLEAGLPLYGHELDVRHTPAEAGMERMLASSAEYVGKAGAFAVKERLVPLRLEGRRAARSGDAVFLPGGERVGCVTSGSFAPSLDCAVALAWVDRAFAGEERFMLHAAKGELPAERATLPFYTRGTARLKLV